MSDFVVILRWVTIGTCFFWLIVYWGGPSGLGAHTRSVMGSQSRLDWAVSWVIGLLTLVLFFVALGINLDWGTLAVWTRDWPLALVGAALTVAGVAGAFASRHYLGRFWTPEASLQNNHQIVDTGPYGLVRHPIYTATLGMYLGTTVVFANGWTVLLCALLVVAYGVKALAEEQLLAANIVSYADYRRRVRFRLVPWLW